MQKCFELKVHSFKRMDDPFDKLCGRPKFVCYVDVSSFTSDILDWMGTNPREQKLSTNIAKNIKKSLFMNSNFHELNRGILISAKNVTFDNKSNIAKVLFDDESVHGNIDGGHTLTIILENKKELEELGEQRYVFCEFITGLESPAELAEARNTSVQVDQKSIEELKGTFELFKQQLKGFSFADNIAYKMFEDKKIDIREIISILMMYNQDLYPNFNKDNLLSETQPVQCYSGKETTLRKFVELDRRDEQVLNMSPIFKGVFDLWDKIEQTFATRANSSGKYKYGGRKYSKFNGGKVVGKTLFYENNLIYIIPKGIMYPVAGAFRSLVKTDKNGKYYWLKAPVQLWESISHNMTSIILDEKSDNPDIIAKNTNLWSNLFKEVYINGFLLNKEL